MKRKSDPRKVEIYLEAAEAYEGGLDLEVERLVDALQQWSRTAALNPRPGFLNELAQELNAQERVPARSEGWLSWFRLGNRLLRGAAAAALAVAAIAFFALWVLSLSSDEPVPAASSPVAPPVPFLSEETASAPVEVERLPNLDAALRIGLSGLLELAGVIFPWLLLATGLLWVLAWLMRRRRAGKAAAMVGLLALLLALGVYRADDVSWRLLPALVRGYHYDPNAKDPDRSLIPERPEVLVERQLEALIGQTGDPPLDPSSPLSGYAIEHVHIVPGEEGLIWRILDPDERRWYAVVNFTLIFAEGFTREVTLGLRAGAGSVMFFPLLGEVPHTPFAWYDSEMAPLGDRFSTPAPGTSVRQENPPLTLEPLAEVDAADVVEPVEPQTSFVAPSAISAGGDLLADVDLREGQRNVGNAILFYLAEGETHPLAGTQLSARATFSPDGQRIAYVRGFGEHDLELVVREVDGSERAIARVDWMTHHWVGNNQIAFSRDDTAILYDLRDGTERSLAALASSELTISRFFRVSPDGRRIAYVDMERRLWVEETDSGERQQVGWDVYELGWGSGMAWRADGEQLVYTTLNDVTLPGQAEVWVWDATSGETTLLARAGAGFLGSRENVRLGKACWVDAETVLFAADLSPSEDVRLLAARTDGSGVWDVTPEGVTVPFPESECGNGYVAVNRSRTAVAVYAIAPAGEDGE